MSLPGAGGNPPGRTEATGEGADDGRQAAEGVGSLTVVQLAERSGVGVPSIHHYRRLGLLPPPVQLAPNRFRYDERHVEALRAIRLLRERRNLSLATIRQVLPDMLGTSEQSAFRPEMWDAVLAVAEVPEVEPDPVRARLVDVARAAFVAHGYAGVNIEQLCQQAGIAKGSFYRYFASKEAIYVTAARSIADVVAAAAGRWRRPLGPDAAVAALASVLRPWLPLLLEVVVRAAHGDDTLAGVAAGVVASVATAVAPRLEGGDEPAGADRCWLARQVADGAMTVLLREAVGLAPAWVGRLPGATDAADRAEGRQAPGTGSGWRRVPQQT
jgi:AcrR family transcriptional regulator/predicted DNA-binding transcriptional regulator AlpA